MTDEPNLPDDVDLTAIAAFRLDQRDGEWCAVSEDGRRSFGCYPTEAEARERLRQVEAAKAARNADEPDAPSKDYAEGGKTLHAVEIFRAGTWNGDRYTLRDLDDMVAAFPDQGYRPPVKLGHSNQVGEPAYGWVENLRRIGEVLVADLVDIPKTVYDAIANRRFDAVSSEIFFNLKRAGRTFRRALKAVALLGAELPAVSDLKPLQDSYKGLSFEGEHICTLTFGDFDMSDETAKKGTGTEDKIASNVADLTAKLEAAEAQLAETQGRLKELSEKAKSKDEALMKFQELQEKYEESNRRVDELIEAQYQAKVAAKVDELTIPALRPYVSALYGLIKATSTETVRFTQEVKDGKAVEIDRNPGEIVDEMIAKINSLGQKIFTEVAHPGKGRPGLQPRTMEASEKNAGQEVHELTMAHMRDTGEKDYRAAMHTVLEAPENAELASRYGQRN